jgi:soluble lytic murein transglycosylase
MAAMFLLSAIWPATSIVRSETVVAAPPEAAALWLAPATTSRRSDVAAAVDDVADGRAAAALPVLTRAARNQEVGGYGLLYLGRAQLALNKLTDARETAAQLDRMNLAGYLSEAAMWLKADIAEAAEDWPATIAALRVLMGVRPLEPERVNLRLGQAASKAGDITLAITALNTVVYDYALSDEAVDAAAELARLNIPLSPSSPEDYARQMKRAQQLFAAKRYSDARAGFVSLRPAATDADRVLVDVRVGACDYFLKRYAAARDELQPLAAGGQNAEAEFYYFSTLRGLGRHEEYVSRVRAFVDAHPTDVLAEEALNNLGTHYVLIGDDEKAAQVLAELYGRFPTGAHANRAAWRTGWFDYKTGKFNEAVRFFESAAATFPRDDYRPMWLYWSARAHGRLGERDAAIAGYRQVITDYRNSYYGRQAMRALTALAPGSSQVDLVRRAMPPEINPGPRPPNAAVIQALLEAGLYDTAILEVRKAQQDFGTTPLLEATLAYALNRKGELRPAIVRMRRAYPQFIADGGEQLPAEVRRVIFPIAYWDLISRSAVEKKLDPYLMAALVAQESTFEPAVKSSAGAIGLMQIEPSTGRRYAAGLRIRPYSTSRLTQPEINVRIGMATFADSIAKFGSIPAALAAYNAGDSRVVRWQAERRDFEQDEFIDDIPFPETQNYVKRVLGTAEDYRTLYSGFVSAGEQAVVRTAKPATSTSTKSAAKAPTKSSSTPKKSPKKASTHKK